MSDIRIDTEIDISAPTARVWEVLTDLPSYGDWNPMIRSASGVVGAGARLTLHFKPEGQRGHIFRPKLLVVEPGRELRWLGSPRFPGVVDSQHYFLLSGNSEGATHLVHGTVFYGILIPLIGRKLEASTRVPFTDMNKALKNRCETGVPQPE